MEGRKILFRVTLKLAIEDLTELSKKETEFCGKKLGFCISQRDDLHTAAFPRIDNLIGQGLDLAIQAEQEAIYECLTST